MPHQRSHTRFLTAAACLLLALPPTGLRAQPAKRPVNLGNIPQLAEGIPFHITTLERSGYIFGRQLDTVLFLGGMAGLAAQQFGDATFFHPVFQKISRHYGLLTVFVKCVQRSTKTLPISENRGMGGIAGVYLQGHEKYMLPPTKFYGQGTTFFQPFTKDFGNGYAMLSVYIKLDEGNKGLPLQMPGKVPFLQLHGNISYTFDHRSRLDTPFAATDLQQHNEQVYVDAVFKDRYPFRAVLSSRQSNSPFFKGYTDVALQFDRNAFRKKIRQELLASLAQKLRAAEPTLKYDALANEQRQKWAALKSWLESPARRQETVQERELAYKELALLEGRQQRLQKDMAGPGQKAFADSLERTALKMAILKLQREMLPENRQMRSMGDSMNRRHPRDSCSLFDRIAIKKDSIAKRVDRARVLMARLERLDSLSKRPTASLRTLGDPALANSTWRRDSALARLGLPTETERKVRAGQRELDSLYKGFTALQKKSDSLKNDMRSELAGYSGQLDRARSIGELDALAKKAGGVGLAGADKHLLALTRFDIGRSNISYSDLTANNISLSGLNVEFNPSYYAALAVGSVDYLFRDFVPQPGNLPKQKLLLGRFGWGDKERHTFILTAYTGTKNSFNGATGTGLPQQTAVDVRHIFGYSLETRYRIGANTDVSFEGAKSSEPYAQVSDRARSMGRAFTFSDHGNEAWSARLNMSMPATRSLLDAFYKQVGANFQSYSTFSSGTRQESWGIKWRQYLWGERLSVTAQVRKNGFDNPLVANTYNSSIVFKSLQATLRMKKWPVLSVGYMPSSQLTKAPDGSFSENIYYTLTSSAFYGYSFYRKRMASSLLYTRFYNKGTDTGFVHYDARDILFTHSIDLGKLRSQSGAQYTEQPNLAYWTLEQQLDLQVGRSLTVGAGAKNYRLANGLAYWGGLATASLRMGGLGGLRMQYDKGYLPNGLGALLANDWGRLSWFKVF